MKYSINPFKWLLWLGRWAKYRRIGWNSAWTHFYYPAKPLSKKGKAELIEKFKAAHARTKFKPPIARTGKGSEE